MARRGRPPHPGPLTPAEERVLEHVRQGLPNAEIAVRLGISVNTVRYHVSNLLGKAGAGSREDLARWQPREEGRGWRWGWLSLGLKPVAVGATAVVAVAVGVFLIVPVPTEEAPEVVLPEPFTRPDPDELEAQGYIDAGKLMEVDVDGDPVLGHSPRSLFTPVLLAGEGRFVEVEGEMTYGDFGYETTGFVERERRLETAGGELTFHAQMWPYTVESAWKVGYRPVVFVWASDRKNATYRATLTTDGHAWIDPEPINTDTAYDEWTGQELGLTGMRSAGWLDPSIANILFTGCGEGACYVSYRVVGSLQAPTDGLLTCESPTRLLLASTVATLQIDWADTGGGSNPRFDCEPHEVVAGETLGPANHYSIEAYDSSGARLSVAITPTGSLWVGHFAPTIACPCRQGT